MRNISPKIDNVGDELTADEFNSDQDELENVVTSTDQSLDSGGGPDNDLNMLGKAFAVYSAAGQYYDDSCGVNNYVLDRSTNLKTVPEYKNGMIAIFKASSVNTGASTINVSSLGSKSLTQFDGSALDAAQIVINDYIHVIYNATNDRFELMGSGVSEFAPGTVMLFGNSTAPVGWTRKTDWQESAMFCYRATGTPNNGGGVNPQSTHNHTGPSHTHTMQSHIHSMQSHTHSGPHHRPTGPSHAHTGPSHTHTGPNHTHTGSGHNHTTLSMTLSTSQIPAHIHTANQVAHNHTYPQLLFYHGVGGDGTRGDKLVGAEGPYNTYTVENMDTSQPAITVNANTGGGASHAHGNTGYGGTGATGGGGTGATGSDGTGNTSYNGTGNTGYAGTNNTGAASVANTGTPSNNTTAAAGTGNTSSNTAPYFQEVIAATKD